jgi:hypothetical protein
MNANHTDDTKIPHHYCQCDVVHWYIICSKHFPVTKKVKGILGEICHLILFKSLNLCMRTRWPESMSELNRLSDRRLSVRQIPMAVLLFFRPEPPLVFLSSSSLIVLTRLSGLRSRPATAQKIW